jgi:predicted RNase H-like HicB family nuclease
MGATSEEVEPEIKAAIRFHLDGLRQDGKLVPRQ